MHRSSSASRGKVILLSSQELCPRLTNRKKGGKTTQRVAHLGEPLLPLHFVKQCQVFCRFVFLHASSF